LIPLSQAVDISPPFQRYIGEVDIGPVVPEVVKQCVEQFEKQRGGKVPAQVIFYHNGASEGWFENLLRYEVPLIRDTLRKAGCASPKITLIVSNRQQSVRLFNKLVGARLLVVHARLFIAASRLD
jgi:Piwi domain